MDIYLARTSVILLMLQMTTACMVPRDMHVSYGIDPKLVDDDVRFRTTYYFRTFDYCWDANVPLRQFPAQKPDNSSGEVVRYRRIIPKTDSLYRYRMTGQASALFSRIRFESGVLKASAIDPFGTQVSFSREADGFYVRSNDEVKSAADGAAKAKADREAKLEKLRVLIDLYVNATYPDIKSAALFTVKSALDDYRSAGAAAAAPEQVTALEQKFDELKSLVNALPTQAQVKSLIDQKVTELQALAEKTAFNQLGLCPVDANIRKGFQIMGPEGLKTFDQNDRLVMAMSTSAKPLIETLQEYSGRVLDGRADATAQQLAIANESLRTESARRTLSDAMRTNPEITVLDGAITAFGASGKGAGQ